MMTPRGGGLREEDPAVGGGYSCEGTGTFWDGGNQVVETELK